MTDTPLYEFVPSPNARRYDAETWESIRNDYTSGMSATEVSRRHGVATSTLYNRAAAERWRRRDKPPVELDDHAAFLEVQCDGDLEALNYFDLADLANTRMRRAMLDARPTEVLRWHRIHALMCEEGRDMDRFIQDEEDVEARHLAIEEAERRAAELLAADARRMESE